MIIEALSKFPMAYPIKSKAAHEIAARLFDYIALFGPPKTILSDQGAEFKGTVKQMLEMTGIDHVVTAAYNPRCNGLTERLNQTLMLMLRKFCERQPAEWDKWLPFTLMCYRTKKHTTTNMTPDFLLFGRERNQFINYTGAPESEIEIRLSELRRLYDTVHPAAIENIKDKQNEQKRSQDNRSSVLKENLAPGTKVMIKNEKILQKLENRFTNRCTVVGVDKNGNYILKDETGDTLKDVVPLQQLKIIKDSDPEQSALEVEAILNHRKINGKYEYFVKWKSQHEENSWINEDQFVTSKIVQDYWSGKRPRGRPRKVNLSLLLTISLCALFLSQKSEAIRLMTSMPMDVCENLENAPMISLKSSCSKPDRHNNSPNTYYVGIFHKLNHQVYGMAKQCKVEKLTYTFESNFVGSKSKYFEEQTFQISIEECKKMIRNNACFGKKMVCVGTICEYEFTADEEYKWWDKVIKSGYRCQVKEQLIEADNKYSVVFRGMNSCVASDLFCKLKDSIVVWNNSVIHECPFELVDEIEMKSTDHHVYVSTSKNLLFNVDSLNAALGNTMMRCGLPLLQTSEGLFIHPIKVYDQNASRTVNAIKAERKPVYEKLKIVRSNRSLEEMNVKSDLILSSMDAAHMSLINVITSLQSKICEMYINAVNSFATLEDKFIRLANTNSGERVAYAHNGILFAPNCFKVREVEIDVRSGKCYDDIPVIVEKDNSTLKMFLSSDRIIKKSSKIRPCENLARFTQVGDKMLSQRGEKVEISDTVNFPMISLNNKVTEFKSFEGMFFHYAGITHDIDIFKDLEAINEVSTGHDYSVSVEKVTMEQVLPDFLSGWNRTTKILATTGILSAITLLILSLIILAIKCNWCPSPSAIWNRFMCKRCRINAELIPVPQEPQRTPDIPRSPPILRPPQPRSTSLRNSRARTVNRPSAPSIEMIPMLTKNRNNTPPPNYSDNESMKRVFGFL